MPYTIESNVPMPRKAGLSNELTRTLMTLNIGDSLLVPEPEKLTAGFAHTATKLTGFRFATRKVEGGTRIWRIA